MFIEWEVKKYEDAVDDRFTQELLQLLFTFFG